MEEQRLSHYERQERPWGQFERFTLEEATTVKVVSVLAGASLSLQKHENRDEFWRILSGDGEITLGEERKKVTQGDECFVARKTNHRISAGENGLTFLEIAFGNFDENDITRLEDKYGRA